MNLLSRFHCALVEFFLLPVKAYRRFLSPLKGSSCCRFTPTCSQYALDALREWGIVCGTALALWRILRCNPFGGFGEDPVPPCPWRKREK
jgi:putative membrane protein insertion efficiency factor